MAADREAGDYSTPVKKLAKFFERSRDGWKRKYLNAKYEAKLANNQARAVERSRDQWKQRCREGQRRIAELEAELQKTAAD